MLKKLMQKKLQIAIALAGLAVGFGGGKYFHYTTTPRYVIDKAGKACARDDMRAFAKGALTFDGKETKPLEGEKLNKLVESSQECPYKELFTRKMSQTRSSSATIQFLGVEDAVKFGFEGEGKIIRVVRLDGGWHVLLVE